MVGDLRPTAARSWLNPDPVDSRLVARPGRGPPTAGKGHEHQFPPPRLSGRCGIRKRSFAGDDPGHLGFWVRLVPGQTAFACPAEQAAAQLAVKPIALNFLADPLTLSGDPTRRAVVELGGARTGVLFSLRRDNTLLGVFLVFTQEVRPFSGRARGVSLERMISQLVPFLRGWAGYVGFSQLREMVSLDG
jgi:group II intron maturase